MKKFFKTIWNIVPIVQQLNDRITSSNHKTREEIELQGVRINKVVDRLIENETKLSDTNRDFNKELKLTKDEIGKALELLQAHFEEANNSQDAKLSSLQESLNSVAEATDKNAKTISAILSALSKRGNEELKNDINLIISANS